MKKPWKEIFIVKSFPIPSSNPGVFSPVPPVVVELHLLVVSSALLAPAPFLGRQSGTVFSGLLFHVQKNKFKDLLGGLSM